MGDERLNLIYLAVSDGDKVTDSSSFQYYSFSSALFPSDSNASSPPFFDYPTLGVDKNSVLIGGNSFFFNNLNGVDSLANVGCVIDKKKLIQGKLLVRAFKLGSASNITGAASGMVTPHGVHNDDPVGEKSFLQALLIITMPL